MARPVALRVLRKLWHISVILALVYSIGVHWFFLQSIAWVGMVVNYSQGSSLTVAVRKTFDGRHPCSLCKAIQRGKNAEKQKQIVTNELKFDWITAGPGQLLKAPPRLRMATCFADVWSDRSQAPPSPPPRISLAVYPRC